MQGPIAQIVALAVAGNAFLSRQNESTVAQVASSTLTFCEFVKFADLSRSSAGWVETTIAETPDDWLRQLKEDGVEALRISHSSAGDTKLGDKQVSDRILVAFVGGGGQWRIEAIKQRVADYWVGRWNIGDRTRADRKIWQVTYGRVNRHQPAPAEPQPNLDELRSKLMENLSAIAAFATDQRLGNFATAFKKGIACLESAGPWQGVFHADLCSNPMLPLPAAQLLAAAQSAWVFGGMGSWNDVAFDGESQLVYERLSEELYGLLNTSIVAATNASAPQLNSPKQSGRRWQFWR